MMRRRFSAVGSVIFDLIKKENRMNKKQIPAWVPYILLVLAVAMCAFGWYRGEWKDVMRKAIAICMECIGIG